MLALTKKRLRLEKEEVSFVAPSKEWNKYFLEMKKGKKKQKQLRTRKLQKDLRKLKDKLKKIKLNDRKGNFKLRIMLVGKNDFYYAPPIPPLKEEDFL
ncbi:hypothetical protein WA026_015877 [Henosepilachna vigintioctopunctata]|uniref:Uncharacterized protein n=1 Tax=Henosepilachna vigintioctopunctata TaxID=420089 RepID=A0AAW1UV30_9CUCU